MSPVFDIWPPGWCLWGRRRAWGPPEWKINNKGDLRCLLARHCELYRTITFLLPSCYHPKWQHTRVCKQWRLSAVWSRSERQRDGPAESFKGSTWGLWHRYIPYVLGRGPFGEEVLSAECWLMSSIIGYPGNAQIRLTGDSKPLLDVTVWETSVLWCTSDPDPGNHQSLTDGWMDTFLGPSVSRICRFCDAINSV